MTLDAIAKPVKIKDYGIHREIFFLHQRNNAIGFALVAVCHAALQIS